MARTHPYAPMHALKHHPLAGWLNSYFENPAQVRAETLKTYREHENRARDEFDAIACIVGRKATQAGELTLTYAPGFVEDTSRMLQEMTLWRASGQKIYEFGAELTRELLETDVHEVTCGDLRPPISTFYLAFDMDKPYVLPDGQLLDGIMMTIIMNEDAETVKALIPNYEGDHVATMDLIIMSRPSKYDITKTPMAITIPLQTHSDPIEKSFHEIMDRYEQAYREGKTGVPNQHQDDIKEALAYMEKRFKFRRTVFADLYRLIAGALLYLSFYHDKGSDGWSPAAPQKFVTKLDGQKTESEKARNWLADKGWSRATYFNIAASERQSEPGEGGNVATHWRRGHWRRAHVGPNRCERKLTWIRPMLINADAGPLQAKTQIVAVDHPK